MTDGQETWLWIGFAGMVGLALLAATTWRVPAATDAIAGAGLALIAALTFPHAAVVGWMDHRQGVFARAGFGRQP